MALPVSVPVLPAAVWNKGASGSPAMPGGGDVFIEVLLQTVVTRNLMLLATFFVQADPAASSLHEIVTHFHLEHGVDPREGVDHHADERAIAQPDERRFVRFRAAVAGPCFWRSQCCRSARAPRRSGKGL